MSSSIDPALPVTVGQSWTFWPQHIPLALPVLLEVEENLVTFAPHPDVHAATIGLKVLHEPISADVAQELAEILLSLPGVERPEVIHRSPRRVTVAVSDPGAVVGSEIVWPVTAELAVYHANYDDGHFALSAAARLAGRTQVELTSADCVELVVALAGLLRWQSELTDAYGALAERRRLALQRRLARGGTRA